MSKHENRKIGGDANWTWESFLRLWKPKLDAAPIAVQGWPHQCRCGEMTLVKYRGRYYCRRCGTRWRRCPYKINGKPCDCPLDDGTHSKAA